MTDHVFPIESAHVLMFVRAIGANDPTPESDVPLTFVQASAHFDPNYPLRPHARDPWFGSGRDPGTQHPTLTRTLHAEQHFEYHRPLELGDVLTWQVRDGETWTKVGRSGGALAFQEVITEYRDAKQHLVVTARAVVVRTQEAPEV